MTSLIFKQKNSKFNSKIVLIVLKLAIFCCTVAFKTDIQKSVQTAETESSEIEVLNKIKENEFRQKMEAKMVSVIYKKWRVRAFFLTPISF